MAAASERSSTEAHPSPLFLHRRLRRHDRNWVVFQVAATRVRVRVVADARGDAPFGRPSRSGALLCAASGLWMSTQS
ncbi:hypothetical protein C4D60_Mb01t06050 [Musa balbisiana]|uniref:Uncharacterized protein n=1 Tax=Musa balbisiana TaxID=52838 RepID=A0A4S8JM77_MUSBA|nr:hypothetical protein C4D60_Mb01t06050 [Musa balbisiana]